MKKRLYVCLGKCPAIVESYEQFKRIGQGKGTLPGKAFSQTDKGRTDAAAFLEARAKGRFFIVSTGMEKGVYLLNGSSKPFYRNGVLYPTVSDAVRAFCDSSPQRKTCKAYVDGSYRQGNGDIYGYGGVFISGDHISTFQKTGRSNGSLPPHLSAELSAALFAVRYLKESGFSDIILYHDNSSVYDWYVKCPKKYEEALAYHDSMLALCEDLNISFVHVKAHSGDKFNDMADKLAKGACEEQSSRCIEVAQCF